MENIQSLLAFFYKTFKANKRWPKNLAKMLKNSKKFSFFGLKTNNWRFFNNFKNLGKISEIKKIAKIRKNC